MRTIEAQLDGRGKRVGVVVARFNHLITRRLLEGCEARLRELGCDETEVMWVPGAFELPLAAQEAAESGRYDALVGIAGDFLAGVMARLRRYARNRFEDDVALLCIESV